MSNAMMWCLTILLASACVAAEMNLMRIFIADWREERRESRRSQARERRAQGTRAEPRRRIGAGICAAATMALIPGLAAAQDAGESEEPAAASEKEAPGSAISVQLNLDYTTAYFYRGIIQEDSGLILQPAARVTLNLHQGESFRIDAFVGTWNSFQGQKTGAQTHGDFTEYWYESDLYGGVTLTAGKVTFTTSYTFLTSPSDAYETVQELGFALAYDDSEWLGKWAMKPYAMVAIETGADASDGANSDAGTYLELGVAPGFSFDVGQTPVTMAFPVSVGLSLSDYYQDASGDDDTFGFAQVGAKASLPLPIGERYGAWTLNAGVALLVLGDHTSDYNAGGDTEVIGTIGLQWNF